MTEFIASNDLQISGVPTWAITQTDEGIFGPSRYHMYTGAPNRLNDLMLAFDMRTLSTQEKIRLAREMLDSLNTGNIDRMEELIAQAMNAPELP